jgi:hypothetical protein
MAGESSRFTGKSNNIMDIIMDFSNHSTADLFVWEQDNQVSQLNNLLEWSRAVNNDVAASTFTSTRAYAANASKQFNAKTKRDVSATYFNSKVQRAVKLTACLQDVKCAAKIDKYVAKARKDGEDVTLFGLYMFVFPAKAAKKDGTNPIVKSVGKVEDMDVLDAIIAAAKARKVELAKLARKAA